MLGYGVLTPCARACQAAASMRSNPKLLNTGVLRVSLIRRPSSERCGSAMSLCLENTLISYISQGQSLRGQLRGRSLPALPNETGAIPVPTPIRFHDTRHYAEGQIMPTGSRRAVEKRWIGIGIIRAARGRLR